MRCIYTSSLKLYCCMHTCICTYVYKCRTRRTSSRSKRGLSIFEPQLRNPESTIELRCSYCTIIVNKLEKDKEELRDKLEKSTKLIKSLQQR